MRIMESLGDFVELRRSLEFQAVIVVEGEDGRMHPLADNCPRCLLPIANRKLLSYQLDLLSKCGLTLQCGRNRWTQIREI